ncbi:DUF6783 domain-containing protein [Robinsoniella peoriensis]
MCSGLWRFVPDSGHIADYVTTIRDQYAASWGVQMSGMNFQIPLGTGISLVMYIGRIWALKQALALRRSKNGLKTVPL